MNFVTTSTKIKSIPYINILLDHALSLWTDINKSNIRPVAIVGWGNRPTTLKSIQLSKKLSLPFIALEDGFLRSYHAGNLSPLLALILDQSGVYYECRRASDLEIIINNVSLDSIDAMTQLKLSRDAILRLKLSKYNHTQDLNDCMLGFDDAARVLVIDQTYGDMSVECGGAFPQSFADMLDAALAENPEATIYLKTHPEVNSGSKKGYLTHIQDSDRIVMIREDVNPIDLIQKMDKVYVVTSQMGFEALMCGKPVVCFGVPWYAGWGVTDDRVKDSPAWARRTKKRTVDELFAAAYLHYTRYLNPFTHERGTIFDVIEWLVLQKKMVANQFKRSF